MHYYQFNIADYRKDTTHLSRLEHSIYRDLIDWYHLDEAPIPLETQSVMRRLRLATQEEATALACVLKDFFTLGNDGYHHHRIDAAIADYKHACSKNKKNGKKGGRPKAAPSLAKNPVGYDSDATGNPLVTLTNNHKPIKELVISNDITCQQAAPADHCPHEKILDIYSESLPELSQPIKSKWAGSASAVQLKARWREDKRHRDLDFWKWFFGVVRSSDFHMGKAVKWKADIHWLVSKRGFNKILELGVNNGR